MASDVLPLIFDIRRFALDDGPGIRTTVFFKGCPLACAWCHNPESQNAMPEIAFRAEVCIGCGECRKVCPRGAIRFSGAESAARIDRQLCNACGLCAEQCPTMALRLIGKAYSEEELLAALLRDHLFFKNSGGGVTFSGGEPTLYMDFLAGLLPRLRQHGIHITLQTCGHFDFNRFSRLLLPNIDLIHFDLKLADPAQHLRYTGRDNALIFKNFRLLADEAKRQMAMAGGDVVEDSENVDGNVGWVERSATHHFPGKAFDGLRYAPPILLRLVPRLTLVPGITADPRNLAAIATLLREAGLPRCQLLPYHPGGLAKLRSLGRTPAAGLPETMLTAGEERHWQGVMALEMGGEGSCGS